VVAAPAAAAILRAALLDCHARNRNVQRRYSGSCATTSVLPTPSRKRTLHAHDGIAKSHAEHAEGGNRMSQHDDNPRDRKHDETRRAFLVGAALGAAAGTGLVSEARAQGHDHPAAASTHAMASADGHGAFFNDDDAATITAFAERIWPAAPGTPGATEIGVPNYIDLALAGAYADMQDFYRRGLTQLDAYCRAMHQKPFARLDAGQQDDVIRALEQGKATGFAWPAAPLFFNTVRTHVMEGLFADPVYGGNKNFEGWRQISFPGGQPLFTAQDMQSREAFTRAPIVGLQAQANTTARKG
jgi:gluconate 2-dehydrogenase gamma chain